MRIERDLGALARHYDLIVVGGGITGVFVAAEAAGRGLSVLLLDKGDFGSGTSSATTKYLHGGIRYLEQYQFAVVRESLRERRILSLAAPHLVARTRFLMPAWKWTKPGALLLGAGVLTYDLLSYDRNRHAPDSLRIPHPQWLSKRKLLAAVPWLDPEDLLGAFGYHDVMNIHPERLLLAFLGNAVAAGAVALNHLEVTGFVRAANGGPDIVVEGVELLDGLTGERYEARGTVVVNAGGPWVDVVLRQAGRPLGVKVQRSKGVHLLTRPLGGRDAVLARTRSGRHVIVSPWQNRSWIGPTDTEVSDDPDDVRTVSSDVELILETVNSAIGPSSSRLTPADVQSTSVGIRPLVVAEGADSYTASRRHELYDHGPAGVHHLWSIAGGKWTTGRATAEEVVDQLLERSALRDRPTRRFDSRRVLAHGSYAWAADAEPYLSQAARTRPELALAPEVRLHLARLYGTDHERLLDLVALDPALGRRISDRGDRYDIAAQVVYAVTEESARTLADIVDRRLVLGTLGTVTDDELRTVAQVAAPLLGWDVESVVEAESSRRAARAALWSF